MNRRRVVVTGLGTVNPLACDVKTTWEGLLEGRSGVGPIQLFDSNAFDVHFGGEVSGFDPSQWMPAKTARRLDRFCQFAVASAAMAFEDAGLDADALDPFRAGVVVGSGIGGLSEFETQHERLMHSGPDKVSPFMIPKLMVNAASGQVSIMLGFRGPNSAVATACASGANAIGDAFRAILYGSADVMITGGAEAALTPMGVSGFCSLRALSRRNDDPPRASRPFDAERDGFVLSEGAGVVVLEEAEHAAKRGARIYAELRGFGATADGTHITAPDANGVGAAKAMSLALADARVNLDEIDYINAHGTSTQLGDEAETFAIKTVFGEHSRKLCVSSTKSQVGHMLGASGGVEMIATCLTLGSGVVPPTINLDSPDPKCDLDFVPHQPREVPVRFAMSNSFGFGGHNACLLVSKFNGF